MSFKQDRTIPGILHAVLMITDPLGRNGKRKILGIERLVKTNFRKQDSFSQIQIKTVRINVLCVYLSQAVS